MGDCRRSSATSAESELVAQALEDAEQDDISGELKIVESCAAAFVETTPACPAGEGSVAEGGAVLPLGDRLGPAVWAGHEQLLVSIETMLP